MSMLTENNMPKSGAEGRKRRQSEWKAEDASTPHRLVFYICFTDLSHFCSLKNKGLTEWKMHCIWINTVLYKYWLQLYTNQCSYHWGKPNKYFVVKVEIVSHLLCRVFQSFQMRQFGLVFHYFWPALLELNWSIRSITSNFVKVNSLGEIRRYTLYGRRLIYDRASVFFTTVRYDAFECWKGFVISFKLTCLKGIRGLQEHREYALDRCNDFR